MLYTFYIEESFNRFAENIFNKLYSQKNKNINTDINLLINNLELINQNGRKLYIYQKNEYFINIIELKNKKYKCYKYITEKYYNIHINIFNKLFEFGYYKMNEFQLFQTERIENYIFDIFIGKNFFNTIIFNYDFDTIIKNNFTKEIIHDKINIDKLNFIEHVQIRGTLIDLCVKYIINNKYDYVLKFIKSCKSIKEIPDNLINCNDTTEFIKTVFDNTFIEKIEKIKNIFINIKTTDFYLNFELDTYGEPDLISDDYIIDIKTGYKNIINKENYLQCLFYAISMNKTNICIYDPFNGIIYKNKIDENIYSTYKEHIINNKLINNHTYKKDTKKYGYKNIIKNNILNDMNNINFPN